MTYKELAEALIGNLHVVKDDFDVMNEHYQDQELKDFTSQRRLYIEKVIAKAEEALAECNK